MILQNDPRRQEFMAKIQHYLEGLVQDHAVSLVDKIMDQVAIENVHSSLPPCLTPGQYIVPLAILWYYF
jgi:hypothetical protein